MTTGDLLTAYRMKSGLTVDEVAEKTGIPPERLMELESGKLAADDYILTMLAGVYGTDAEALRSDDPGTVAPPVEPAQRAYRPREERESVFRKFVKTGAGAWKEYETGGGEEAPNEGARDLAGIGRWMTAFPFPIAVVVVYLLLGFTLRLWHPAWLLFLLIPVWYRLAYALKEPNPRRRLLKMPAITGAVFLYVCAGIFIPHSWLWAWVIFPLAGLYYWRVFVYGKLW